MWVGDILPTFRSNPPLWSSCLRWIRGVVKLKIKALCFFETSGTTIQPYGSKTQKTCSLNTKTFTTNNILQRCHFQRVMRRDFRTTSVLSFTVVFFLCLACYTSDRMSGCGMGRMTWRRARDLNGRCWRGKKKKASPLPHHLSRSSTLQAALYGRKDSASLAFQHMRCKILYNTK